MFFLFLVSTSATWWLTVKRLAHTGRLFLWLSFTTVWQLTLGTLTFNIPLPTVNSFYNQAALPWTQTQYQTLVCVEVQHTESRRATSFAGTERRGIHHTCSSSVRRPNHNLTHYSCSSLYHSIHFHFIALHISSVPLFFSFFYTCIISMFWRRKVTQVIYCMYNQCVFHSL